MPSNQEFVRFMAMWALVHETADEGWKAAVARGESPGGEGEASGPGAFVDGLAAMIAEEKERLKTELAAAEQGPDVPSADLEAALESLRFEVAEVRGMLESLQASVDALTARGGDGAGEP